MVLEKGKTNEQQIPDQVSLQFLFVMLNQLHIYELLPLSIEKCVYFFGMLIINI